MSLENLINLRFLIDLYFESHFAGSVLTSVDRTRGQLIIKVAVVVVVLVYLKVVW